MRFLVFILTLFPLRAMSQDIHWSQFDANPIFQNPGNTGHFNGDVRFVGNYRDQWRAVTTPFQTISISADGKPYNHRNLGIGGLFFHDMSGDGTFRTIELQLNASYVFKLSKDSNHIIRPGVNIGMNHRQINWNALSFGNQYNGITYDPTLPTNELYANDRKTNFSAGLGAIYEFNIDKRKQITAGASAFNLNRPNQGFYFTKVRRDIRTNVFLRGTYPLGFDFDLIPSMQLTIQGKYREYMVGSSLKYTLVNRLGTYRAVYAGLWYRNRDAAFLSLGMDYQNWFVGLSYDINFSSLAVASNARGGMEIAVRYVINRFKISKAIHRVCPDYI